MKAFPGTSKSDYGASMVEYGLMVAVVALVALAAVTLLGEKTDETFTTIAVSLEDDGTGRVPVGPNGESAETGDPGDSGTPGGAGNDTTPGNQSDDDQGQDQDDPGNQPGNDEPGEQLDNGGDDDESNGGSNDDESNGGDSNGGSGDDVENEEDDKAEVYPGVSNIDTKILWQNKREGAWEGLATYRNDTRRDQELTLKITQVDDQGKETVRTYSLYVHANSSKEYSTNYHLTNGIQKGDPQTGVVEVRIEVESIRTHTNWDFYTYEVDDSPVVVKAPQFG